jgi:peptidoglycan/LPS O-acetylase OafA/YrhL
LGKGKLAVSTAHRIQLKEGDARPQPVPVARDLEPLADRAAPTTRDRDVEARHRGLPYVGSLDGFRGVAVIGVVLFHSGVALPGGFLGVSTFFTLSGFLITSLLLADQRSPRGISLRAFWVRRCRRLLPAALLAIALCVLVTMLIGDASQRAALRGDGLAALGYAANWRFVFSGESYGGQFAAPSAVLHFWSLAIEEQFYLAFPLLAFAVLRVGHQSKARFAAVLGALFVASCALPHLFTLSNDRIYFGTDTRASELLAGALLAVGLDLRGQAIDRVGQQWSKRTRVAMALVGAVAFEVVLLTWWMASSQSAWVYAGGLPLYAGLTTVVIVAALARGNPLAVLFSLRPLRFLGRISYGVYLFHWPIFLWLSPQRTGWQPVPRLLAAGALTLVVATVSYAVIEQPIRQRKPLLRRLDPTDEFAVLRRPARVARVAPIAILAVGALVVLTTTPPATGPALELEAAAGTLITDIDTSVGAGPLDTTAPRPRADASTAATENPHAGRPSAALTAARREPLAPKPIRAPSRPLRVLVVGDSTALFLDPVLNAWGGDHQVWGAANYARIGCGLGRGGQRRNHHGTEWIPRECGNWASEWPAVLRSTKPDIVVVADGFWDATDRQLLGDAQWRAPGDPVYDQYLRTELGQAADVLGSTGAVVAWLDNPPIDLGAEEQPRFSDYSVNDPARMVRTNEILHEVAATRPSMRVIPYRSFFEAWPGGALDRTLRPDGVHVDADGGRIVADWLGPEVLDAYWNATAPSH